MTPVPIAVTPMDTISHAAALMWDLRIGCLPVVEHLEFPVLLGLIVDRDIAVRCVVKGHPPSCLVHEHMIDPAFQTVHADADVSEVREKMERAHVRRVLLVVDDNMLVGIIAQADLATVSSPLPHAFPVRTAMAPVAATTAALLVT